MSSPAASCALTTHATASRYCSRKIESPSADLNDRPRRLSLNQSGRGYDPVMAVGSIRSRVTFSIAIPPRVFLRRRGDGRRLDPEEAEAVVPGDIRVRLRRKPEGTQRPVHRLLGRHVRVIRSDHDLPRPDQVDVITEGPPVGDQRVVVEAAGGLAWPARPRSLRPRAPAGARPVPLPRPPPVGGGAGGGERGRARPP